MIEGQEVEDKKNGQLLVYYGYAIPHKITL